MFQCACAAWKEQLAQKDKAAAEGFTYKTVSPEIICTEINALPVALQHGLQVAPHIICSALKEGRAGALRAGAKGCILEECFHALCEAVKSCAILSQQQGQKLSNVRPLVTHIINACVNKKEGEGARNGQGLFECIQKEIAGKIKLGKPQRVEQ